MPMKQKSDGGREVMVLPEAGERECQKFGRSGVQKLDGRREMFLKCH